MGTAFSAIGFAVAIRTGSGRAMRRCELFVPLLFLTTTFVPLHAMADWPRVAATLNHRRGLLARTAWAFSVSSVGATSSTVAPRLARFLRPRTPAPKAVQACGSRPTCAVTGSSPGRSRPAIGPASEESVFRLIGGRYGDAGGVVDFST